MWTRIRLALFWGLLLLTVCLADSVFPANAAGNRVLFLGDLSFGENYYTIRGVDTITGNRRYTYPLEKFRPILADSFMAIANLETPVTHDLSEPVENKTYLHWTHPIKTPEALVKHNIKVVSLANNHSLDYGYTGLEDTLKYLDSQGISRMGAGMDQERAQSPFHFKIGVDEDSLDCFVIAAFEYLKNYEKYSFYAGEGEPGVYGLDPSLISLQISNIRSEYPGAFIILFPHWGNNYSWRSRKQKEIAHQLIEGGADLILGHGAHMIQEIECYKDKWIVYSLGNFMFNSQGRYGKYNVDPISLIAQLEFISYENEGKIILKLYPIITDNKITRYQGYFVDNSTFKKVVRTLVEKDNSGSLQEKLILDHDLFGDYIELTVR